MAVPPITEQTERRIRVWLDDFVVGLNLCPFARPLLGAANLRIAVCAETAPVMLRAAVCMGCGHAMMR